MLLGNNKSCKIAGIEYMRFKFHDEVVKLLTIVRYVPYLKRNIISLGELNKKRYMFKGEQGVLKIIEGLKEVMRSIKRNGLYSLEAKIVTGSTAITSKKSLTKTKLWHMRLSHVIEKRLIELGKQNQLCGDKAEKLGFCEPCGFGKACKAKFNKQK